MLNRAYSLVTIKGFDPVRRTFTGIATSPEADRVGDVIESKGIQYKNPLPLLLYHDNKKPVGEARFGTSTKDGTPFSALISKLDRTDGVVRERLDEAVDSLAADPPLIRGVSIGFRALEPPQFMKDTGGYRFTRIEVVELSMVVVPAHQSATIDLVKSLDAAHLAATGRTGAPSSSSTVPPGAPGVSARAARTRGAMKTYAEQIAAFETSRTEKQARRDEIQAKAAEESRSKDEAEKEEFQTLTAEIKAIDEELVDLRELEASMRAKAVPVSGANPSDADEARSGKPRVIHVKESLPPGIEYTRMILCKAASFLEFQRGNFKSPLQFAMERHPDNPRIHRTLQAMEKATVPPATTTTPAWAGVLIDPQNLASEFVEYLRPETIIGKFGRNGIPALRSAPFNIRFIGQTSDAEGYWVGEGKPKPLTSFALEATTLTWAKIATITVITDETARFSSPSAEMLARDALRAAIVKRSDIDFIDPAKALSANVSPASITNGVTPLSSSGTSADNVRTDLQNLLEQFISNNQDVSGLVLIMPNTLALALSLMRNSLGNREFPDLRINGGFLEGIPVITSQYAANQSGSGNLVIAVNASEIFLSDDGQVTVDASREASLEMSNTPTQNGVVGTGASLVSLWQNNMLGLKAERFINWAKRRDEAVSFMDDVNWGSIGSPS